MALAIASHNGYKAAQRAWAEMAAGTPPLEACVEGITLVEDDPNDMTVGYGGLPNEDGVVELDAAVMDGARHRGGAVAGLQGIRNPCRVAKLVMEQTNRVLLVGEGAKRFALANGFREENLLTDQARRMWLYWRRRRSQHDDWIAPETDDEMDLYRWYEKVFYNPPTGTVHCSVQDNQGNIACVTSTSGHAFKLAGRVGDSPILGAGLYVDNQVGSCGSIGDGELNLQNCSSFAVVELMRGGAAPLEAGLEVLRRIDEKIHQTGYRNRKAESDLTFFVLAKDGRHAGVSMRPGRTYSLTDGDGSRLIDCVSLRQP